MISYKKIPLIKNREKILSKISINPEGCWNWMGHKTPDGYGVTYTEGGEYKAHRVMYDIFKGIISTSNVIDHLCNNTSCVNPDHLSEKAQRDNLLRSGITNASINIKKDRCIRGHLFDLKNTWVQKKIHRFCKSCKSDNQNEKRKIGR